MEHMREREADRDWAKSLATAAAALLIGLLGAYLSQARALKAANARISATYQRAFYETCELMEGLDGNLRKLLVASGAQESELLGEIARQAEGAQSDLAALPLSEDAVAGSIKFVNQTGDFARALSVKLAAGGAVTEKDYENMAALSAAAGEFSAGLRQLLAKWEAGETAFSLADFAPADGEGLYPLDNPASEYPVLLYDGPFSDGRADGRMRALEGQEEISAEEAGRRLTAFLGAERVEELRYEGESAIPAACYEFTLRAGGYPVSAGVTRHGGKVLYLLTDEGVSERNWTDEEAVRAAGRFLRENGFGEMEMSYFSRFEGVLTVNFAAVQAGVVLYPDLVKVQVSLRDGAVIGLEAANYLNNHYERDLPTPQISEAEALARLNPLLTPERTRLCVIPTDGEEALCYEATARRGEETFLVYVDALSGEVRSILQLLSDGNGQLVM